MKTLIYISLISLVLFSCKKDKLEGDMQILEGKWKWSYSREVLRDIGTSELISSVIVQASTFPDTYHVEFDRKGKIKFLKNNEVEDKYRIVMSLFFPENCEFGECQHFSVYLNNDSENEFSGLVGTDTLWAGGSGYIPLKKPDLNFSKYSYTHYYIRDN